MAKYHYLACKKTLFGGLKPLKMFTSANEATAYAFENAGKKGVVFRQKGDWEMEPLSEKGEE